MAVLTSSYDDARTWFAVGDPMTKATATRPRKTPPNTEVRIGRHDPDLSKPAPPLIAGPRNVSDEDIRRAVERLFHEGKRALQQG